MRRTVCTFGILALALTLFSSGPAAGPGDLETKPLRVGGSDNVARFVNVYGREYMSQHPGANIVVIGGKTSTGFRSLLEGNVELAMASRRLNPSEREKAQEKGITVKETQIGWCSIVIVTHPANPVSELDKNQLAKIFKGEYTNWNEVGGPNQPIVVVGSEDQDFDPVVFFKESILGGSPYTSNAVIVGAYQTILPKVLQTGGAISFCRVTDLEYREQRHQSSAHNTGHGAGHDERATDMPKVLAINEGPGTQAIIPPSHKDHTAAATPTAHRSLYPLRYPLYVYFVDNAQKPFIERFVDYCVVRGMGKAVEHGHGGH